MKPSMLLESEWRAASNENPGVKGYDYGLGYNQINMLEGDILHNNDYRGQGITIALLDAGFFRVNEFSVFDSLRKNKQIKGTWDFVSGNAQVFDDDSHGSSVLSTIAANAAGQLTGTAPMADFWLLRTEDAGSERPIEESNWVAGAEFADSVGADIISSSLGYNEFDAPFHDSNHTYQQMDGHTTLISRGANMAANKGMTRKGSTDADIRQNAA